MSKQIRVLVEIMLKCFSPDSIPVGQSSEGMKLWRTSSASSSSPLSLDTQILDEPYLTL